VSLTRAISDTAPNWPTVCSPQPQPTRIGSRSGDLWPTESADFAL
jgi:hypothetical protein